MFESKNRLKVKTGKHELSAEGAGGLGAAIVLVAIVAAVWLTAKANGWL